MSSTTQGISVNAGAQALLERLRAEPARYRVRRLQLDNGTEVIDAGIEVRGGIEAGRLITEICMGGLGRVSVAHDSTGGPWPWQLQVASVNPVLACLASQYAGWSLKHGEGKDAFRALGSGPARALGSREPLFEELGYRDASDIAVLVLEVDDLPPAGLAEDIAAACGVAAEALTLVLTPTASLAGAVQVVGRVLEVGLHKAHELGFPLEAIVDGLGAAPLCPPSPDPLTAMGRTNDAIIFSGDLHLFVAAGDEQAEGLAQALPSAGSADFGRPFAELFAAYEYDFYKVDKMLFSPARVAVTALESGRTFFGGELAPDLLHASFA